MARWIRAKLLLRAGKVAEAEALLAQTRAALPASPDPDHDLWTAYEVGAQTAGRPRASGELGAVRLARGEYVPALDDLLRGGWWTDAAYVAERVLTVDELRAYVDKTWPADARRPLQAGDARDVDEPGDIWEIQFAGLAPPPDERIAYDLRYLLGRRLARAGRLADARPYLPESRRAALDDLAALAGSGARSVPPRRRAVPGALPRRLPRPLSGDGADSARRSSPTGSSTADSSSRTPSPRPAPIPRRTATSAPRPTSGSGRPATAPCPTSASITGTRGWIWPRRRRSCCPPAPRRGPACSPPPATGSRGWTRKAARPLYDAIQSCCANTEIARRSRKVNAITNVEDACPADVRPKGEE